MQNKKPKPVVMELYPTLGSTQEVIELAESKLPITTRNELLTLLYTYHNTLLSQLSPQNDWGMHPYWS